MHSTMDVVYFPSGQPPTKKAKVAKASLYAAPTSEEMQQLKETENLFQSSLFRLQVNI